MKKLLMIAALVAVPAIAVAQSGTSAEATVTEPSAGSTVRDQFVMKGAINKDCTISGAFYEDSRGGTVVDKSAATVTQTGGSYEVRFDLSKVLTSATNFYAASGAITVGINSDDCTGTGSDNTAAQVKLTYRPGSASTTASPSPAASVVPAATTNAEVEDDSAGNLDPEWWILIGMVVGAGLVFTLEQLTQHHWKHYKTK